MTHTILIADDEALERRGVELLLRRHFPRTHQAGHLIDHIHPGKVPVQAPDPLHAGDRVPVPAQIADEQTAGDGKAFYFPQTETVAHA